MIENIGHEPWLPGGAAAALVDKRIMGDAQPGGDEISDFFELANVVAAVRHGLRNAVGGVDDLRGLPKVFRQFAKRISDSIFVGFDESRMVEKNAQLVDCGCARANYILRLGDVLAVLSASGVRTVGRCYEGERISNSVLLHLPESVGEHRMPVTV